MIHDLKCWPEPFLATASGRKTHELRSTLDRKFAVGDVLRLREYVPSEDWFTGRVLYRKVTYICPDPLLQVQGWCAMSVAPLAALQVAVGDTLGWWTVKEMRAADASGHRLAVVTCKCGTNYVRRVHRLVRAVLVGGVPKCPACSSKERSNEHIQEQTSSAGE